MSRSAASCGPGRCAWTPSFTQVSGVSRGLSTLRVFHKKTLLELSARPSLLSLPGMAALHEAVLTGNLEVVKLLVKYGADVHQRDEDGWTPLHMACSDGYPEIAK